MDSSMGHDIEEVIFQPGDVLFEENEQSFHFFIIQEGEVEVFKTGGDGQPIPLAIVGEGSSIGEFAMIDRLPRSATARAKTQVRAAKVSDGAYQQLLHELPDWAVAVMKALVERIRATNEIVRRASSMDEKTRHVIDSFEFDPDASTIVDENPLLNPDND